MAVGIIYWRVFKFLRVLYAMVTEKDEERTPPSDCLVDSVVRASKLTGCTACISGLKRRCGRCGRKCGFGKEAREHSGRCHGWIKGKRQELLLDFIQGELRKVNLRIKRSFFDVVFHNITCLLPLAVDFVVDKPKSRGKFVQSLA